MIEVDVLEGAAATAKTLAELELPDRCLIVAIIQQEYVRVPGASDRLKAGDTAIILVEDDVVDSALGFFVPVS